jgi:hypothetical protein
VPLPSYRWRPAGSYEGKTTPKPKIVRGASNKTNATEFALAVSPISNFKSEI